MRSIRNKNFFEKYRRDCEKCNKGKSVVIPANDSKNGIPGKNKIDIMFINERPGPRATEVISFGNHDPSAMLFRHLFFKTFGKQIGEQYRSHIFITNAMIWVPTGNVRNYPPTRQELRDKRTLSILKKQIGAVRPELIVTLGNSALYSMQNLFIQSSKLSGFRLKEDIGKLIDDTPINIYPVYHTGLQARRTRNIKKQEEDWLRIKKFIKTKNYDN